MFPDYHTRYKCYVVFNKSHYNTASSAIVYSAMIESLESVGFNCIILFADEVEATFRSIHFHDVILFVNFPLLCLTSEKAHEILINIKGVKVSVGCDDEYLYRHTIHFAKYMDKVITFDTVTLEYLKQLGIQCSLCPHALSPVNFSDDQNKYAYDVSFIGRISPDKPHRLKFINQIKEEFDNFYAPGLSGEYVSLEKMHEVFRNSKINLNLTGISSFNENPLPLETFKRGFKGRPFEVGACGGFCLSERSPALEYILNGLDCIDFFDSADDCIAKIKYYLSNDSERVDKAINLAKFTSEKINSTNSKNLFGTEILKTLEQFNSMGKPLTLYEKYGESTQSHLEPSVELSRLIQLLKNNKKYDFGKQILFLLKNDFWQGSKLITQCIWHATKFVFNKSFNVNKVTEG